MLVALSAHLVAVPAVGADKLETLVRDVLGNGGDEAAGRENLEVALYLRVEPGAVDDRAVWVGAAWLCNLHLIDGEGVTDDVLGDPLKLLAFVGEYPPAAVHVEPGMHPAAQHVRPCRRQEALVHEKR